ncbi:MAG TPA: tetratricopeptide repeat protein [Methanocorpusculum sp.]|nr:tetratricopeptide repeat protein [Methanocorpusculum sp.]
MKADAAFNQGLHFYAARNFVRATECFTDALRDNPENVNYYYYRGVCFQEMGDTQKAISDYSKALLRQPSVSAILNNRAELFLESGDSDNALADYAAILSSDKAEDAHWRALAFMGRGLISLGEGRVEEAISDMSSAEDLAKKEGDKLLLARIGDELERSGF